MRAFKVAKVAKDRLDPLFFKHKSKKQKSPLYFFFTMASVQQVNKKWQCLSLTTRVRYFIAAACNH